MIHLCVTPERQQKTLLIMRAMQGSLRGSAICHGAPPDRRAAFAVWGHLWTGARLVPPALQAGAPFWFVDNGWHLPARGRPVGYYGITYRSIMPMLLDQPDMTRLPVAMAPWRDPANSSGPVLLCLPGGAFGRMFGWDMASWARGAASALRRHTSREILMRDKDCPRPLAEDLERAAVVVTHSSKVAVDAVLAGVPVIVEPGCAAAPVGGTDLAMVDAPPMPDRARWWGSLMCQQFTLSELRRGVAAPWLEVARRQGEREIVAGVPPMTRLFGS